jgi:hypothetical protein
MHIYSTASPCDEWCSRAKTDRMNPQSYDASRERVRQFVENDTQCVGNLQSYKNEYGKSVHRLAAQSRIPARAQAPLDTATSNREDPHR